MINRLTLGEVPPKHHIQFRSSEGALRHEECLTQEGFDGPYTILYHVAAPHTQVQATPQLTFDLPKRRVDLPLLKRHFKSQELKPTSGGVIRSRRIFLFNDDVTLAILKPQESDPSYFVNGDADDLYYIHEGQGVLRTMLGDLPFYQGEYVCAPKGVVHRFILPENTPQHWLSIECRAGVRVPKQFRNDVGQLKMDAPYSHRDFRAPTSVAPIDENIRHVTVKRQDAFHGFEYQDAPLDVVGYDGTIYPWAFHILNFQARAGLVHLPPTIHGTFATRGALICSFVPRMVDFHEKAIPCPYPHASVDVDEFIFYCKGSFTSRRGIGAGSISLHPAGIAHGPHPGSYEASIGSKSTSELAVMLDTLNPLWVNESAFAFEDPNYQASFRP